MHAIPVPRTGQTHGTNYYDARRHILITVNHSLDDSGNIELIVVEGGVVRRAYVPPPDHCTIAELGLLAANLPARFGVEIDLAGNRLRVVPVDDDSLADIRDRAFAAGQPGPSHLVVLPTRRSVAFRRLSVDQVWEP